MLKRLRYWRNKKGYSVRELAQIAGVDSSTITLAENGHREPHGRTVRKLAQALGVKVEDLYAEDTDFESLRSEASPS